jgi:proteasome assembly chaperone (PAC2) family protein
MLVAAFSGWSDAGDAATGAVQYLVRYRQAELLAEFDSEDFYDFTQHRPIVNVDATGMRELIWPRNRFYIAEGTETTAPLLLFVGVEPSLKWRTFSAAFMDLAQSTDVEHVVTFGSLLNAVPHTRPPQVNASGSKQDVQRIMQGLGIQRGGSYRGPTGIASAIIEVCQQRSIAYSSFWGHVPHYIQTAPNPAVIQAILQNLSRTFGIAVNLKELEGQAAAFYERCEQAIAQEPSMRAYVKRLEQYFDEVANQDAASASASSASATPRNVALEFPNPEDLVEDLEDFLRQRRRPRGGSQDADQEDLQ